MTATATTYRALTLAESQAIEQWHNVRWMVLVMVTQMLCNLANLRKAGAWTNHPRELGTWLANRTPGTDNKYLNLAMDEFTSLPSWPWILALLDALGWGGRTEATLVLRAIALSKMSRAGLHAMHRSAEFRDLI